MKFRKANDLIDGLLDYELWTHLAWQDIKLRYRLSKIGPFWITFSMSIFVVTLGFVYSRLFNSSIDEYLPFLAIGFVIWTFIAGLITESPEAFISNAGYIKDTRINPLSILCRATMRHVIIFLHNALIILGIYLYFGLEPTLYILLVLPGFALVMLNLYAISVMLSVVGVRYRDLTSIVQSMVQVLFFVTPLMWFPRLVSEDSWIIAINPFSYYLDLTRSPLLGKLPMNESWAVGVATLFLFSSGAFALYKVKARRIPFWL